MNHIELRNLPATDICQIIKSAARLSMKWKIIQDGFGILIYYNDPLELFTLGAECN